MEHLNEPLVAATIHIYSTITSQLLPTPAKSHYTFNLRDLSKVFQGMLMAEPAKIEVSYIFIISGTWHVVVVVKYCFSTKKQTKRFTEKIKLLNDSLSQKCSQSFKKIMAMAY